mmetsp:Transcript_13327/g.42119  ORF Transcript_13327/g.42119 Transcript_13327/m.42119 type:complete len:340 (-) Transcript_13327:99-1118(-)
MVLLGDGVDEGADLVVVHELPEAVGGGDDELVVGLNGALDEVGLGGDAGGVCDDVADGARHGEAREVEVAEPDARRTVDAVVVLDREDPAAGGDDAIFFLREIGLVVCREGDGAGGGPEGDARVADVGDEEDAVAEATEDERRAAELGVDGGVVDELALEAGDGVLDGAAHPGPPERPVGVAEDAVAEVFLEEVRDDLARLAVAVQDQNRLRPRRDVLHQLQRVLVLLPRVVRRVPFPRGAPDPRDVAIAVANRARHHLPLALPQPQPTQPPVERRRRRRPLRRRRRRYLQRGHPAAPLAHRPAARPRRRRLLDPAPLPPRRLAAHCTGTPVHQRRPRR